MSVSNVNIKTRWGNLTYWLIALAFFYLGMHLSIIGYLNTEWFTRSGCIVVILGIWSSLGAIIHEQVIVRRANWKRNRELNKSKKRLFKENNDPTLSATVIDKINTASDKELAEAIHHVRLSIGALEVSLLISGTFVWGFGDILMEFLF